MQGFQEEDFTKRFDLSLWKKLLIIAKPFHRDLLFVAILMGMSALVDVLLPLMNAYAIDNYIARQETAGLGTFITFYVGLLAIQVFVIWAFLRLCGRVEVGVAYTIRKRGFRSFRSCRFRTMTACL